MAKVLDLNEARRRATVPDAIRRDDYILFTIPGPAPGAVRQTQSDRWKKRPCVLAYREWCDWARQCCERRPEAHETAVVRIRAFYEPPQSWTKGKRRAAIGTAKRSKPDGDNIAKAVIDALWENDERLGDITVERRWDTHARTLLEIYLAPTP